MWTWLFRTNPVFSESMNREIPERDWKVFRDLRQVALNRLCEKILADLRQQMERPGQTPHENYLSVYKLINRRDRDIARAFNDFRRSTALLQIGVIHSLGLLTAEELHRFSPETLQIVALYGAIPDA